MEKLGVELPLLITQVVNFTIMLLVLTKLLYKPILTALDERKRKIEEGLAFSEKAKQEEEKLEQKREEVLAKAREEAKKILEAAKKEGGHLKEELVKEGKEEARELKAKMEKEMKGREEEIQAEIASHTVEIATEMVKRLLPHILNEKGKHAFIEKQLTHLEKRHEQKK